MKVIFYNESGSVVGYKENVTSEEEITFRMPYVVVTEIPDEVRNTPAGKVAKFNKTLTLFYTVDAPEQEPSAEDLKKEIAILKQRDAKMQEDITLIVESLMGGI